MCLFSLHQDKVERAQYEARRIKMRNNMKNRIRARFQVSTVQSLDAKKSTTEKMKPPLQPFFLGGIPKDEFLKGLQKSLANMPLDLSSNVSKNIRA